MSPVLTSGPAAAASSGVAALAFDAMFFLPFVTFLAACALVVVILLCELARRPRITFITPVQTGSKAIRHERRTRVAIESC